jgi:hypothetical protein
MSATLSIHRRHADKTGKALAFTITDCRADGCEVNLSLERHDGQGYVYVEVCWMGISPADCDALIEAAVETKKVLRKAKGE